MTIKYRYEIFQFSTQNGHRLVCFIVADSSVLLCMTFIVVKFKT